MISAGVVKDLVYPEEIDDNSDVDDSFTCRTDQTTVRVSNVRRVTFTGAMDDATETADQLIQRLFADVDDRFCVLPLTLNTLLHDPRIEPGYAVRNLRGFWGDEGVELSEEIFLDLARFSGGRRYEFIDALTRFVEHLAQQGVMGTAQDSPSPSSSLTNSVAISGGAATSDGVLSTACSLASDIRSAASSTTVLPNSDETLSIDGAASAAASLTSNEGASARIKRLSRPAFLLQDGNKIRHVQ